MISASHARHITEQPARPLRVSVSWQNVSFFLGKLDKSIENAARRRETSLAFIFPPAWDVDERSTVMVTLRGAGYDVRLLCGARYAVSWAKRSVTEGQLKEGAS